MCIVPASVGPPTGTLDNDDESVGEVSVCAGQAGDEMCTSGTARLRSG